MGPTNRDLAGAGENYRPTPWDVANVMYYWADSDTTPDLPLPKEWNLVRKDSDGS